MQDAQNWLDDRARQEHIIKQRQAYDSNLAALDDKIQRLNNSRADMISNIDQLKQRRTDLMKELQEVEEELNREEVKLSSLPGVIADFQEKKAVIAQRVQILRNREQPIPRSADADRRDINEVDKIRLDGINAIHSLGIV